MPCSPPSAAHVCRPHGFHRRRQVLLPVENCPSKPSLVTMDHRNWTHVGGTAHLAPRPPQETPSPFCPTPITDQDITYDIYNYIIELMDPHGIDTSLCFEQASLQPPITTESLAELDIPRIINNPKLRHDVNFRSRVTFRPNLDGSRGRQKMKSADHYLEGFGG